MSEPLTDMELTHLRYGLERGVMQSATPATVRGLLARLEQAERACDDAKRTHAILLEERASAERALFDLRYEHGNKLAAKAADFKKEADTLRATLVEKERALADYRNAEIPLPSDMCPCGHSASEATGDTLQDHEPDCIVYVRAELTTLRATLARVEGERDREHARWLDAVAAGQTDFSRLTAERDGLRAALEKIKIVVYGTGRPETEIEARVGEIARDALAALGRPRPICA